MTRNVTHRRRNARAVGWMTRETTTTTTAAETTRETTTTGARDGASGESPRTIWSYRDEFHGMAGYDYSKGLRYTKDKIALMTRANERLMDVYKECDMHIDDQEERALNMLRRTRAKPMRAPDEPAPLTLRPFGAKPGDESGDVQYTYMNELTTVGDVMEDVAEMEGTFPSAISLVHAGKKLYPPIFTLSDCNVHAGYVVYWIVDKHLVHLD